MSLRILVGRFKGRELLTPSGADVVRPMTGLIRKSLFDILAPRLEDAVVADLYCATGTLGLEALSRGARRCFFAERDHRVARLLRRNIETLAAGNCCTVWEGDLTARLEKRLEEAGEKIDVAFVDPPFPDARRWSWPQVTEEIFAPLARHLADSGVVVLRLPAAVEAPAALGSLALAREKRYGGMNVLLLERAIPRDKEEAEEKETEAKAEEKATTDYTD